MRALAVLPATGAWRNGRAMTDNLTILGLESSCDDTAAAVVRLHDEGAVILSSVVLGQNDLHEAFGGVVPEIAARAQHRCSRPVRLEGFQIVRRFEPQWLHDMLSLVACSTWPSSVPVPSEL